MFGRKDIKTGCLTNLTDGGEGVSGYVYSFEQKEERRQRMPGDKNHMFGKKRTEEEREKISQTKRKKLASGEIVPTKHTEEHKQKLREHNPGGEATARPIYQIDLQTGEVIKEWKSMRQAGLNLKIHSWRNIVVATKNKNKQVGGFYWRWVDDSGDIINEVLQNVEQYNTWRTDKSLRTSQPILQILEDGTEIVWKNMCEAARELKINNSAISAAIKAEKPYAGYR